MNDNIVRKLLGRPLRLAVIGGGPGSFIGAIHQRAAIMDRRYEICASVLSSDPVKSRRYGKDMGIPKDRCYGTWEELFAAESARSDKVDVVAIMTPNDSHHDIAVSALENGFHVICDKPMTNTVKEARSLYETVIKSGLVFCLTHNYTGYPMVRQARALCEEGVLGIPRLIQVEYVQGGKADERDPDPEKGDIPWRYDPEIGGPSLVMGDIGTHAHNLIRYITGLEVDEVCAEAGAVVPGRKVHDFAGALLRFPGGARGNFWVTQTAAGVENCLRIRVSGTKGSLEWMQEMPQILTFKPLEGPVVTYTPNGPGCSALTGHSCRIVKGHPEGFPEAFANIYSDAAESIACALAGETPDLLSLTFPDASDGLAGVEFVDAVLRSSDAGSVWTRVVSG